MALPTQQRCRNSRFQPYTGCGSNTGAVTRYNGYKAVNPFLWPRQDQSKQSWWGPSVYGPPWWAYPVAVQSSYFPCNIIALVRTTHASIGIIRHFVGFLAKCKGNMCPISGEAREEERKMNNRCGRPGHDHTKEPPFCLSRFWLSTEMGMNPNKQDITVICSARPNTAEIQTVVLGPAADGTTIDAETGEVALLSRDGESGEMTLVSAVRDLTREIVLTQSLYEIDLRRQYFSDPAKYGYLLRELDQLSQPPSRRLVRRLDSSGAEGGQDVLEAIPVDAEQLLQICSAYGFSESETRRVLEHFTYVQRRLESHRGTSGDDSTSGPLVSYGENTMIPRCARSSPNRKRGPSFSAALNGGFGATSHYETLERFCVNVSPSYGILPRVQDGFGGDLLSRDSSCHIDDHDVTNGDYNVGMETDGGGAVGDDFLTRHAEFLSVGENVPVQLIDDGSAGRSRGVSVGGRSVPFDADSGETW